VQWYPDVRGLMRELKMLGAHNINAQRARGLTGKDALARMTAAYELQRRDTGLPATWQVVYAAGWAPEVSPDATGATHPGEHGEVRVDVAQLQASLNRRRR
jgi:malonyl-CoA O-methyltransferase